jgi:hypothetical protein
MVHMVFVLFRWWYGTGWAIAAKRGGRWAASIERNFSAGLLVKTLFSPWRRIVSLPGKGLDAKIHAVLDNFVSRCIGFVVRSVVLLAAGLGLLAALAGGGLLAIAWPLIPPAILYCIVRGITG